MMYQMINSAVQYPCLMQELARDLGIASNNSLQYVFYGAAASGVSFRSPRMYVGSGLAR